MHPDDRGPLEVDRSRLSDGRRASYRAERRYSRNGRQRALGARRPRRWCATRSGAPLYFIGQIQDITERHLARGGAPRVARRAPPERGEAAAPRATPGGDPRGGAQAPRLRPPRRRLPGARRRRHPGRVAAAEARADAGRARRRVRARRPLSRTRWSSTCACSRASSGRCCCATSGSTGSLRSLADGMSSPTLAVVDRRSRRRSRGSTRRPR